jgi:hypothetical protein
MGLVLGGKVMLDWMAGFQGGKRGFGQERDRVSLISGETRDSFLEKWREINE